MTRIQSHLRCASTRFRAREKSSSQGIAITSAPRARAISALSSVEPVSPTSMRSANEETLFRQRASVAPPSFTIMEISMVGFIQRGPGVVEPLSATKPFYFNRLRSTKKISTSRHRRRLVAKGLIYNGRNAQCNLVCKRPCTDLHANRQSRGRRPHRDNHSWRAQCVEPLRIAHCIEILDRLAVDGPCPLSVPPCRSCRHRMQQYRKLIQLFERPGSHQVQLSPCSQQLRAGQLACS